MPHPGHEEVTRARLLEAAGEVFSKKGFHAATVRDICRRAGANVAAVNYHFGGKEKLYEAALAHAVSEVHRRFPPQFGQDEAQTPEERLHAFIRAMLLRMLTRGRHAWHGRLMAREMAEPSAMLARPIDRTLAPASALLRRIITDIMPPGAERRAVDLCAHSVIGQCRVYSLSRPILKQLYPDLPVDEDGLDGLAAHVTRFSLAAIRHYAEVPAPAAPTPTPDGEPS